MRHLTIWACIVIAAGWFGCAGKGRRVHAPIAGRTERAATSRPVPWYAGVTVKTEPEERLDFEVGGGLDPAIRTWREGGGDAFLARREGAYEILLTTETFASSVVGVGGGVSMQVMAFRVILAQPDAREVFVDLLGRGRLAGQLYALCGLYLVDRAAFEREVWRYREDDRVVLAVFGCIGMGWKVRDLVARELRMENGEVQKYGIASGDFPRAFAGLPGQ